MGSKSLVSYIGTDFRMRMLYIFLKFLSVFVPMRYFVDKANYYDCFICG